MDKLMTIWNLAAASLAVWRLSRMLLEEKGSGRIFHVSGENIFANRALDCICWLSIWLSAQTAIWVAGGLTGVLLNCFVFSHLSRPSDLSSRSSAHPSEGLAALEEAPVRARSHTSDDEIPYLAADCGMQAHHG